MVELLRGGIGPLEREFEDFRAEVLDLALEGPMRDRHDELMWLSGAMAACRALQAGATAQQLILEIYRLNQRSKAGGI